MTPLPKLKLGLIGANIARSRAPVLHRLAGRQAGIVVTYDRLVPADRGETFDATFEACRALGYHGVNVTYPFKEAAAARVRIDDPHVQAIGAVNTVLFDPGRPRGLNTDYSGFLAAYRAARGDADPGRVCLIGAGGVGRALAFALVALGAGEIRLVDSEVGKAHALAADLRAVRNAPRVVVFKEPESAARGATGILNGTPLGMTGHGGTPLARGAMTGAAWAFDAVYTPMDTRFLRDAIAENLSVISGYELFFHQGVHAWTHFSGTPVDADLLRADLASGDDGA